MPAPVVRMAPTPSGYLHLGNAFNFLLNWLIARAEKGTVVLRIDDLDSQRVKSTYVDDVFFTLEWLGLNWDVGPGSAEELKLRFSQKWRMPLYEKALDELMKMELIYACNCSRAELKQKGFAVRYPGICKEKNLALNKRNKWRLKVEDDFTISWNDMLLGKQVIDVAAERGDFVVRRKDGIPAYQLSSVIDDSFWGINTIIRGEDLLPSTACQLYFAEKLSLPFKWVSFGHHKLVLDNSHQKLSKSTGGLKRVTLREIFGNRKKVYSLFLSWLGSQTREKPDTIEDLLSLCLSLKNLPSRPEGGGILA